MSISASLRHKLLAKLELPTIHVECSMQHMLDMAPRRMQAYLALARYILIVEFLHGQAQNLLLARRQLTEKVAALF